VLSFHPASTATSPLTPLSLVSCLAHGVRGCGCFFPMV
jgi:hypothetical protein